MHRKLLNKEFFDAVSKVETFKGVACFGHGFDGIVIDSAAENKILVANAASFGTEEDSNHALMMLLICAKKFVLHDKLVRQGTWTREFLSPMGHISGQTIGIVGIGNIGRAMGRKCRALGMNVIAYDPSVSSWDFKEYGVGYISSINELCEKSDYISLHCPLLESTEKLMGSEQFKKMKSTAYLINCSRGPVVDELALIEALNNKEIAGAGLDVFEQEPPDPNNPLLKNKKILFACDTGVGNVYKELGEKYGPIDLTFINIGAYNFYPLSPNKDKSSYHTNPEEALGIARDLKSKKVLGMHWGTVVLSLEPIMEPPIRFKDNAENYGFKK